MAYDKKFYDHIGSMDSTNKLLHEFFFTQLLIPALLYDLCIIPKRVLYMPSYTYHIEGLSSHSTIRNKSTRGVIM